MPPVTVSPWREVLRADTFGPVCPQNLPEVIFVMMIDVVVVALAQIPISTFSHIWVLVRQYGIMFVIIVIIIIIIIIYRKVKVSTLKHV